MKILIALSGGVDSSVVAHLLHRQGHELIGVMMKLWTDPLAPAVTRALPTKCCSVEHIRRARSVCEKLAIPFYVLNLENEFKKQVVDPFLQGYRNGETPNPCIECNRTIKFGALLNKTEELGCDMLATGHYARIAEEIASDGSKRHLLLEALDVSKDQSYYLYTLTQEKLKRILFPLGTLRKEEVFGLAKQFDVPIPDYYRESQDLCFYPEKEPEAFLRRYIDMEPGEIRTEDGMIVGSHKGLALYTIGQRRGLGIGGLKIPLHVVRKDTSANTITVAPDGADLESDVFTDSLHWISWVPEAAIPTEFEARVHSLGEKRKGLYSSVNDTHRFQFQDRIRGIAAGQSIVLYLSLIHI